MLAADYVVVGSGLTGATIARLLSDKGREVIVLERRSHLGGNVHDTLHPSGVRIHTYGPHYFRTSCDWIWEYAQRFGEFYPYEARVVSLVDGRYEHWPVTRECVNRLAGDAKPPFQGTPRNFEEAALSMMPQVIFDKFVKPYTEKQWGVSCSQLSAELCKRFDVRESDTRLSTAKYQGLPRAGYAAWMESMLRGIPTVLNFDFIQRRREVKARKQLIFTGPIDEFYGFDMGKLKYRSQKRTLYDTVGGFLGTDAAQINTPAHSTTIRLLDWGKMMEKEQLGPVTAEEPYTPTDPSAYEYPFPDDANDILYRHYAARSHPGVTFAGRLATYKYFDMDGAIAHGRKTAEALLAA